ncbi:MAG: GNAT family N-acetyltransferase [Trebonia sp.]
MGWCTTHDLDRFLTEAGSYLSSRAAENMLLLAATQSVGDADQDARPAGARRGGRHDAHPGQPGDRAAETTGPGPLFGWWEPPDGGGTRGAFLHDPAEPLLIAGRAPETAASLAAALARAGRSVCGVDAAAEAADAFAAAWSQRAGVATRVHRHTLVYRLAGAPQTGLGPTGRLRTAAEADRPLLVAWLTAFSAEVGELTGAPEATADELLGYGGAVFWEAGGQPVAMAAVTRPVMRTVRITMMYTPPEHRHNGYAVAVTLAVSHAELARRASEVVLITDSNRPHRQAAQLGYELIGERAVLRFGPATGSIPRLPTGPLPRLRSR